MLTQCPECELPVSDKAITCPHCGYPLKPEEAKKYKPCKSRRMRLPNGFGRITELKGRNLRKPFRAMVTTGKDEYGRPIAKPLKPQAYFKTYNEAYAALVEYNKSPYDLAQEMTVKDLYETWLPKYKKGLRQESSAKPYEYAWAYCKEISNMPIRDLRARHIKGIMEEGTATGKNGNLRHTTPVTKERIKLLFNMMLDYAVEYELVEKNYARTFVLPAEITRMKEQQYKQHIIFEKEEVNILWKNIDKPYVNVILLHCYSGWRPQELSLIRLEDVDLDNWTFKGGIKTISGKDRVVPIHELIRPIVQDLYDEAVSIGSKYLVNCRDKQTHRDKYFFTYDFYKNRFYKLMDELGLNLDHRLHDCRKTFVTMCKKAGVDEYAIKYMVGHSISDLTEKVYTDRKNDIEWLHAEIAKIE